MWLVIPLLCQLITSIASRAAVPLGESGVLPILVQQVCRHGDRAPFAFFPNNQHEDYWIQGLGYLTPIGEKQLFDNGAAFRSDWYPGLLDDIVYPSESYVVSSHIDRAIMSANSFLAGLYPPTGQFEFQPGLSWQAFPTHMISKQLDYYLYGTNCPPYDAAKERIRSSASYLEFLSENEIFINQTCQLAGYSEEKYNIDSINVINDNLICDAAHNLSWPSWASESVQTRLTNIMNIDRNFQYTDPELLYLDTGGGPLLGVMLDSIKAKINGSLSQKFIYYSAHDATVLPFLGIMEQAVGPNPSYGSCGVLELYQDSGDDLYVQLVYRNSTNGMKSEPLLMPQCSDVYCEYATFEKMVATKVNPDPAVSCEATAATHKRKAKRIELTVM